MAYGMYLRRTKVAGGDEYLFLTAETVEELGDDKLIGPMLPGNNETSLRGGSNSSNFLFNMGSIKVALGISGFILPMQAAKYPSPLPSASDTYLPSSAAYNSPAAVTGRRQKRALWQFWGAQSRVPTTYTKVYIGLTDYSDVGDGENKTIGGSAYWEWEGFMSKPRSTMVAGEVDQYLYNFTFVVGYI